MYGRPRKKVKVQRGSTFTFKRDLPYITSISFTRVKITQQWKSPFTACRKRDPRPGETQLSY